MSNDSIEGLIQELESFVTQSGADSSLSTESLSRGKQLLNALKIAMMEAPASDALTLQSALALELGVLLSVMEGNLEAFGRNMAQLQPYYHILASLPSHADGSLVKTPRKHHIIGLNLMSLLVDNRLAEFHSCLEWLSCDEAAVNDPLIQFPISLERKLMVGIYDEVLTGTLPHPSYQLFMTHLLQTVRDSIADCMEVSYPSLQLSQAAALMKFESLQELEAYIESDRDDWIMDEAKNKLTFAPAEVAATATAQTSAVTPVTGALEDTVPSLQWIQQSLTYATELERII